MNNRFEVIITENLPGITGTAKIEILRDKETDVLYLVRDTMRGCGITVMVDKDGKPVRYEASI